VLISSAVFCALWFVLLVRIRREGLAAGVPSQPAPREAVTH
jgi:hypothetical protein